MPYTKENKKALTFIELMVVTVILSVVSLAVYATFSSGIKIWKRISKPIDNEDLNIFFDKFTTDVRNGIKFEGIDFIGSEGGFSLATLVSSQALGKRTVGEVSYYFNESAKSLNSELKDYSQLFKKSKAIPGYSIGNIRNAKFQYYVYDAEKKKFVWQDAWANEELPFAIRLELELNDEKATPKFEKTISLATASMPKQ